MDKLRNLQLLNALNEAWMPHAGQVQAGRAVFNSESDLIYVECGRKFGKSEFAVYCCWMYALTRPNAEVYYLAPAVKQAKELVWANSRMQTCNTYQNDFLKKIERIFGGEIKIYHHEMRIILPNGSFIKVDGSDNYNTQRGLKPDFVVADEYRDFKAPWIEAVRPNMSVKKGKILFITTPPHSPNHAYNMAEECKHGMSTNDPHYFYLNLPSTCNDRIPGHTEWLKREEARLLRLGRRNEWRREYMAEYIPNNEHAVLPHLTRDSLTPYKSLIDTLKVQNHEYSLHIAIDPSNSATFAALLALYDPYDAKLYLMDCYKQTDASLTSCRETWPVICQYRDALLNDLEHIIGKTSISSNISTPWFNRDLLELFDVPSSMVPKEFKDPIYNISLIKDISSAGKLVISDKLKPLISEAETYQRSHETLRIPRDDKPLINCLRYLIWDCNYTTELLATPAGMPEDENLLENFMNRVPFDTRMKELRAERYGILMDAPELWIDEETY